MYEGGGFSQATIDTLEDNARLIAAAPEMLEALERVVRELDWEGGETGGFVVPDDNWLAQARVAIAKARGAGD